MLKLLSDWLMHRGLQIAPSYQHRFEISNQAIAVFLKVKFLYDSSDHVAEEHVAYAYTG